MTNSRQASAMVVSVERRRPPKQILHIDLQLDLHDDEHWLIIADSIADDGRPSIPSGVHTIDRFELPSGHDVIWCKGDVGAYALACPTGGKVSVSGLRVNRWGALPERPLLAVSLAREITVGNRPLAEIFDTPIERRSVSEVDASSLTTATSIAQRLTTPFDDPFEILATVAGSFEVELSDGS